MHIESIYQETILEYSRRKENNRQLEGDILIERGHNPNCGDDLTLLVKEKNGMVEDASFLGKGCAISTASTNILIDLIKGKSVENAKHKISLFFKMMSKDTELTEDEKDELDDAQMLEYFSSMPARIKCATLSWHSADIIFKKQN